MKAPNITQGEWTLHGGNIVQDDGGNDIAKCWMITGKKETSNARAIAALPECLKALEIALIVCDHAHNKGCAPAGAARAVREALTAAGYTE